MNESTKLKEICGRIAIILMCIAIVVTFIPTNSESVFAADSKKMNADVDVEETITLDAESIDFDAESLALYEDYVDTVVSNIESAGDNQDAIQDAINEAAVEESEAVETIESIAAEAVIEQSDCQGNYKLELSDDFLEEYERSVVIDEKKEIVINPYGIIVTTIECEEPSDEEFSLVGDVVNTYIPTAYAASKSTGNKKKTTYGYNIAGLKLWGVTVECNFYYNGKKAWYKSGYDGYAKRYLSGMLWSSYAGRDTREKSGTSYIAAYSCNVCWGLQIKGQGLVIQDKRVTSKLTCSKKGNITKSGTVK